jgi:hypothetical protein
MPPRESSPKFTPGDAVSPGPREWLTLEVAGNAKLRPAELLSGNHPRSRREVPYPYTYNCRPQLRADLKEQFSCVSKEA